MNILAIESSCDETAAAIISGDPFAENDTPKILSNVVVSQIDIFKAYGGVIPEVAARSHLEAILPVIHEAFDKAGFKKDDKDDWSKIDAIAVTHTPGLLGSLLIGTLTARTLAILHNKPLYAVHHLKSHIYANWLEKEGKLLSSPTSAVATRTGDEPCEDRREERFGGDSSLPSFPLLALVISGGHTQIIRMTDHNNFEIIGTTLDDAIGECFDKVAKILGLPYPGGPAIAKAAKSGNPEKYKLPIPNIKGLDFSFSGLKTAVLRAVQKELGVPISTPSHELKNLLSNQQVNDFAASFENVACEILIRKLKKALELYPDTKSIVFAGGVSANKRLRDEASCENHGILVFYPELSFSGDNAAMVGAACFYEIQKGVKPTDPYSLNILPRSAIN
ncbi:tRNA (adenosine(37)-N6)-threonylcarbamoyltransferase complex transferase subunit TsaD [Candidatus Saccharibacteria bacterium]|nr:tRNA (adenosine(37)-N6)-threonylcarbamoyltransferase complex transferase subunit TsaD [Candidatus Saccharibacteria bacterium]